MDLAKSTPHMAAEQTQQKHSVLSLEPSPKILRKKYSTSHSQPRNATAGGRVPNLIFNVVRLHLYLYAFPRLSIAKPKPRFAHNLCPTQPMQPAILNLSSSNHLPPLPPDQSTSLVFTLPSSQARLPHVPIPLDRCLSFPHSQV